MNTRWKLAYKLLLYGLILFSLYFGTPILGTMTFHHHFDCSITFGSPDSPCTILGFEMGFRTSLYRVPVISAFITPIAYLFAFFELIALWTAATLFCRYKSNKHEVLH